MEQWQYTQKINIMNTTRMKAISPYTLLQTHPPLIPRISILTTIEESAGIIVQHNKK